MLEIEIAETARAVWDGMFGIPLGRGDGDVTGPSITAVVHIDGAWSGALTLHCPTALASDLTTRLFNESSDEMIRDLVGELANQIGGNVKAMLPSPCTLSLPAVAIGTDYNLRVVDTTLVGRARLACDGAPVVISLLERTA